MDFDLKVLHSFCFAQSFLNSPKDGQRLAPVSALTEIHDQPSKGRINNCFGLKRRKESNVYAEGFFRGRTGAWLGSPLITHSGQIAPTQYIDCSHIESRTYIKYIGCFVTFFDGTAQQISNEDIGIYNLKNTWWICKIVRLFLLFIMWNTDKQWWPQQK